MRLALQMLQAGQAQAVAEYCRIVLKKFTPESKQMHELLKRALAAERSGASKRDG